MYAALTTDMDILRAGVASGMEAIESARGQAARLREGFPVEDVLEEVCSCLYRAGHSAMTVGLVEISRSAQEVEDALEQLRRWDRALSNEELELLDEALSLLMALLLNVNVRTGSYTTPDAERCLDRLRAACA